MGGPRPQPSGDLSRETPHSELSLPSVLRNPPKPRVPPAPGRPSTTGCGIHSPGVSSWMGCSGSGPCWGPGAQLRLLGGSKASGFPLSLSLLSVGGDGTQHSALRGVVSGTCQDHKCWWTHGPRSLGPQDGDRGTQRGTPAWSQRSLQPRSLITLPPESLKPFLAWGSRACSSLDGVLALPDTRCRS